MPKNLKQFVVLCLILSLSFSPLVHAQVAEAPSQESDLLSSATSTAELLSDTESTTTLSADVLEPGTTEVSESALPNTDTTIAAVAAPAETDPESEHISSDTTLFWNGRTEIIEDGAKRSTFSGGWVNYLNEQSQSWRPINTTIFPTSGGFAMKEALFEAHFPLRSTGTAVMHNNNQYDIWNKERVTEPAMDMRITAQGVNDVPGVLVRGDLMGPTALRANTSYVLYEGAYPDGDLIYYIDDGVAPRLGKLIRFTREPQQLDYGFTITYSEPQEFETNDRAAKTQKKWDKQARLSIGKDEVLRVKKPASDKRGFGMKRFTIWDSDLTHQTNGTGVRNQEPIEVTMELAGENTYTLTKHLPRAFFSNNPTYPVYTDTTTTVYPDPNTETTSVDGRVARGYDAAWSTARDATDGTTKDDSTADDSAGTVNKQAEGYHIGRGFFLFDTSSLNDGDVVSAGTISIYPTSFANSDNDQYAYEVFVSSNPAANTALVTADFDQVGSTAYTDTVDIDNLSAGVYADFTLTASGRAAISSTGISKFAMREGHDFENVAPDTNGSTGVNGMSMAETSGTSQDPKLVITHEPGVGSNNLQRTTYTYDAVGNIISITDSASNSASSTKTYTYDDLYRLTHASTTFPATGQTGYSRRYTYNAVGNIITASTTASVSTYVYSGNEGSNYANPHAVTDRASSTITYDIKGNVTNDGTYTYTWDHNNRLTQAYRSVATTSTYGYDHTGQRIALREGTATTTYPNRFYNKNATTTTATTTKHIFANGMLIATVDGNGSATSTHYVHTDHLTGSNVISNVAGVQEQLLDYLPFGEIRINEKAGSFDEQRKFTGHEVDQQTELTYMNARYYPATAMRFLSQDPLFWVLPRSYLIDPQQQDSYSYGRNNPIRFLDSRGTAIEDFAGPYGPVRLGGYNTGELYGSYRGIPIYSNGGNYGSDYQCVEFADRFVAQNWGIPSSALREMINTNGQDYVAPTLNGWLGTDLITQYNGVVGNTLPTEDSIIAFGPGPNNLNGHVGVIGAVNFNAGTGKGNVTIAHQNTRDFKTTLPISVNKDGAYSVGNFSGMPVTGWTSPARSSSPAGAPVGRSSSGNDSGNKLNAISRILGQISETISSLIKSIK
jgi:RHS repeat-associated protein